MPSPAPSALHLIRPRMTPELRQMDGTGARTEEIRAAALGQGLFGLKRHSAVLLTGASRRSKK